jgi:hypothetical protein
MEFPTKTEQSKKEQYREFVFFKEMMGFFG